MQQRLIIVIGYKRPGGETEALYVGPQMESALQVMALADPRRWSRVELYRKPPIFQKRILG